MKSKRIDMLINHLDDCLLYVDGEAYSDIDYREVDAILLLKEPLNGAAEINVKKTNLLYEDFPSILDQVFYYQI